MTQVVFVRHATNVKEGNDPPLVERVGRKEATKAGRTLIKLYPNRGEIIGRTSPSRRTVETAQVISEITGVKFSPDKRLVEIAVQPPGMSKEEYETELNRSLQDRGYPLPTTGITARQAAEVLQEAILSNVDQEDRDSTLIVVGHSGSFAAHWRDTRYVSGVHERLGEIDLAGLRRAIPPASVTRFDVASDGKLVLVEDPETILRLQEVHRSGRKE